MNPHFANGERLLRQGRSREAVDAFRNALSQDPHDARTYAFLALAHHDAKQPGEAMQAAREAVRLDPADDFTHYVLGLMHLVGGKLVDAARSANEALRLRPDHSEYYRLLAMIRAEENNHAEALRLVDLGLEQDPHDSDCLNLRSQLLVRLGRRDEARQTSDAALASAPDNADSHANAGWTALHNNQTKEALGHFKESLRLSPGNAWAKAGLAEALKARNPIYRVLLIFILWMNRLDGRTQFFLILGGWLAMRAMRTVADEVPAARVVLLPLIVLYFVFVALTWVGQPLFDLTLMLSPYGRHALDTLQRWSAMVFGLFVTIGLVCVGLAMAGASGLFYGWAILAGVCAVTIPRTIAETETWRRVAMGVLSTLILIGGAGGILAIPALGDGNNLTTLGLAVAGLSLFAFVWLPAVSGLKR